MWQNRLEKDPKDSFHPHSFKFRIYFWRSRVQRQGTCIVHLDVKTNGKENNKINMETCSSSR